MASSIKLTIQQGATFQHVLTWKTGPIPTPVDLTGWTARMQIRDNVSAVAVLLELTTENGRIALGGVAGTITLNVNAADTAAIQWTKGVFDLELVNPALTPVYVKNLVQGTVQVRKEVTR